MKKLFCLLLALLLLFSFAACGEDKGGTDNTKSGMTDAKTDKTETCTVTYADAGMKEETVEKGSTLQQPADPDKNGCIFGGWYTDAALTTPAAFPIIVNANTTLYAKFYDYKTAFAAAREKTIGSNVAGFEYDYTTNVTASYNAFSLAGKTEGNAKYTTAGTVSFYDEHTNSGVLFYDGTGYQIKRGNLLQKISLDEDGLLTKYESEEVDASYRFDGSSFAKALFEYDDSQLKSIEKTNSPNEYKLNTSFNASAGIAMASKALNNGMVKKLIGNVPENNVNTGMYVTFAGGELLSYRYEMQISVTSIQFTLVYMLTFKNVGRAQTVTPRTFEGLALTAAEIAAAKTEVSDFISAFEANTASGYGFTVKTGVDFASANEINATFKGSAMRKTIDGTTYFHNDIEIDSDYKNADLYKAAGIADVHIKRTRLTNGDVYNIEKKLLADATAQIAPYTANRTDSYYLFDLFAQIENYTFVQKVTKGDTITYAIGVASGDVANVLTYLNTQLDLDPLGKATADPVVFGSFAAASVTPDETKLIVTVKNGALASVAMEADGEYRTAFAGSRDFTATAVAEYSVSYTLTVRADGSSFVPYETVKAAK